MFYVDGEQTPEINSYFILTFHFIALQPFPTRVSLRPNMTYDLDASKFQTINQLDGSKPTRTYVTDFL